MSGSAPAEDVTLSAGFDIRREDFWRSSINLIKEKVSLFEELVEDRR
jgi:oligoendopeptidase F